MRRFRSCLTAAFLLVLIVAGTGWFYYSRWVSAPSFVKVRLEKALSEVLDSDVTVEDLKIHAGTGRIKALNLKLSQQPGKQMFQVQSVEVELVSGSNFSDLLSGDISIETIRLTNSEIDFSAGFLKTDFLAPFPDKIPVVPAKSIIIENLRLKTPFGHIELSKAGFESVPSANVSVGFLNLGGNFLNCTGAVEFRLAHDQGMSKVKLELNDIKVSTNPGLLVLSLLHGVRIDSGTIDLILEWEGDLLKRISSPAENLSQLLFNELKGRVDLREFRARYSGMLAEASLSLNRGEENHWAHEAEILIGSGSAVVSGLISGAEDESLWWHESSISAQEIDPALWYGIFGFSPPGELSLGKVSLKSDVSGNHESVVASGRLRLSEISFRDLVCSEASCDFNLSEGKITLAFDLDTGQGRVAATSAFRVVPELDDEILVEGTLDAVELAILSKFLDKFNGAGLLSGKFNLSLNPREPQQIGYKVSAVIRKVVFDFFKADQVDLEGSGKGLDWNLETAQIKFDDGSLIIGHGDLGEDSGRFEVEVDRVGLSRFGVKPEVARAHVSGNAVVRGGLSSLEVSGSLRANKLELKGLEYGELSADLRLNRSGLKLYNLLVAHGQEGTIKGFFGFDFQSDRISALDLDLQGISLPNVISRVAPEIPPEAITKGKLSGIFSMLLPGGEPIWEFDITGQDIVAWSENISLAGIKGGFFRGILEVEHLFLHAFNGSLDLNGRLYPDGEFVGAVIGDKLRVERISNLKHFVPDLYGLVSFEGNLLWSDKDKNGRFSILAEELRVGSRDVGNLGCEIQIDSEKLHIPRAVLDSLGVEVSGNLFWTEGWPYDAEIKLNNTDLSFVPTFHGITDVDPGGLILDGVCRISGKIGEQYPDFMELRLENAEIIRESDRIVNNKPIRITYRAGVFHIDSLQFKYRHGILGFEGSFNPHAETSIKVSGRDFSILALGRLAKIPDWNVNGSLSLDGLITGRHPDLLLKTELSLKNLSSSGVFVPGIRLECQVDRKGVFVDNLSIDFPGFRVLGQGVIPFQIGEETLPIDLRVRIPPGSIADLPTMLPEMFHTASGSISAEIMLSGKPSSPVISGDLNLRADTLGIRGLARPLRNIVFDVATNDGIVTMKPISVDIGRGTLTGDGAIDFKNGPGSITVDLAGDNLEFAYLGVEGSGMKSTLSVRGNLYNPVIRGFVHVPRGRAAISDKLLVKSDKKTRLPFKTLDYNIEFDVPRNFWVKNSFLNAEMRGKFGISGTMNKFNLHGGISVVQGWLYFQRRKFNLETGEVRFGEMSGKIDPHIFAKSVTNIQNTQVFLTLQGQVSSFTSNIYSSPPHSEADIYALLALGRNFEQARSSDPMDLFENEILEGLKSTYISGLVGTTLSTALNLDEVFLGSMFDRTSGSSRSFIRVGKYIGNNFFLAYEGTLREEDQQTFILEYQLPRGFHLTLEFERPNERGRAGLKYHWRF